MKPMIGRLIATPNTNTQPESAIHQGETKSEGLVSSTVLVVVETTSDAFTSPLRAGDIIFHQPHYAQPLPDREDGAFVILEAQIDCYESV